MKVFISHSSIDKKFARTLKSDLNENGIDTFVDEDSLEIGDSLKERLEVALDESSHFIIILSNNATKSEWVKFELKEALSLFNEKTLAKIIPINYRKCEIPKELENLLYGDLSEDIVQVQNDRIKFLTDGYEKLLPKLIKTLQTSDKRLNRNDKTEIKKEAEESEKILEKQLESKFLTRHKIIAYKDGATVAFYAKKIAQAKNLKELKTIFPILLPSFYKAIFTDLKIGDIIYFSIEKTKKYKCHFAGFRITETGIAMQTTVRKTLNLQTGFEYNFAIDIKGKVFNRL
jgi:hypothetical protein